jgi:CheY-like chemotaxis protein
MNAEPDRHEPAKAGAASARHPGILIADDMALLLTLLKFEFESRGFLVWLAVDGDDALDLYRRHREEIDLVLLDVQMPGRDGPHILAALQQLNPDVLACFMTGNASLYAQEELLERGATCVFNKPFRPSEVADRLQSSGLFPNSAASLCDWQAPSNGTGRNASVCGADSRTRPGTPR